MFHQNWCLSLARPFSSWTPLLKKSVLTQMLRDLALLHLVTPLPFSRTHVFHSVAYWTHKCFSVFHWLISLLHAWYVNDIMSNLAVLLMQLYLVGIMQADIATPYGIRKIRYLNCISQTSHGKVWQQSFSPGRGAFTTTTFEHPMHHLNRHCCI